MTLLSIMVFLALAGIAALHAAWGAGVAWPAANRDDLFHLVVGASRGRSMPGLGQSLVAAGAILCAGFVALLAADLISVPISAGWVTALGSIVASIFAGRGIAAYTPLWRAHFSKEPFATMDQSWYGPFCLLLSVAFAVMLIKRAMT